MNKKPEYTMAIIATTLVLFSTILNPIISTILAIILLIIFFTYENKKLKK